MRFLVIVNHPPDRGTNVTTHRGPSIRWIEAATAESAARDAKVEPGGHALVVPEDDIARFDNPERPVLEQRMLDGSLMPEAA